MEENSGGSRIGVSLAPIYYLLSLKRQPAYMSGKRLSRKPLL
jgi:hypothetical protein